MLDSRFVVENEVVDAKNPEQAVRKASVAYREGAVITVVEWTGKTTQFVVGKKKKVIELAR